MKAILKSKLMFFDTLKPLRWSRAGPACKRLNPSSKLKEIAHATRKQYCLPNQRPTANPADHRYELIKYLPNTCSSPTPLCLDAAYVSTRQTRLALSTEAAPTDIIWPYVKIYHISRALSCEEASNCISTKDLPSLGFSYLGTCMLVGRG